MFSFAHLQSCHNGWVSNIPRLNIGCQSIMTRLKIGKTKHHIVHLPLSNEAWHLFYLMSIILASRNWSNPVKMSRQLSQIHIMLKYWYSSWYNTWQVKLAYNDSVMFLQYSWSRPIHISSIHIHFLWLFSSSR